jgi:tRNA (guanosine-2'-O-)-methyltransferase
LEQELISLLEPYVTDHKVQLINNVLNERTRHLTVMLEDLYDAHNVSAVIRTCDCFGIQDLYIAQKLHDYEVNPNIVRGASKWVNLEKYVRSDDSPARCITDLKKKGYRIVGTTPDQNSASVHELDISNKTALVFGTELRGLSDYAKEAADELVHIPMYGFTESFNISVSAALILNDLVAKLKKSTIAWKLSTKEKNELKLEWYQRIVKRSDIHIKNYLNQNERKR